MIKLENEPYQVWYSEKDAVSGGWIRKNDPFTNYDDAMAYTDYLTTLDYVRNILVERQNTEYTSTAYIKVSFSVKNPVGINSPPFRLEKPK